MVAGVSATELAGSRHPSERETECSSVSRQGQRKKERVLISFNLMVASDQNLFHSNSDRWFSAPAYAADYPKSYIHAVGSRFHG